MIELPPAAELWLPPKPAILRQAPDLVRQPEVLAAFLPGWFPGVGGGKKQISYSYLGALSSSGVSGTATATATMGNLVVPRPGIVALGVVGRAPSGTGYSLSGCNVGGAGSIAGSPTSASSPTGIAYRVVPDGTHSVTLTFSRNSGSSSLTNATAGAWLIENFTSPTPIAAQTSATSGTFVQVTMTIPANGIAIYIAIRVGTGATLSWSTADNQPLSILDANAHVGAKITSDPLVNHAESSSGGASAARRVWGATFQ